MINEKHLQAKECYQNRDYVQAVEIINDLLDDDPDDPAALFILGGVFIQTGKRGLAYNINSRCIAQNPDRSEVWTNFGRCHNDDAEGWEKAEQCFNKALELNPDSTAAMGNMSSLMIQQCRPEDGLIWAKKALDLDPEYTVALSCLGFIYLMQGKWKDGFHFYEYMMGHTSRPVIHYNDAPKWNGKSGQVIMVNGEQGIGDELIYSSFLKDIAKENKVVYDCMPRLKNLMQRSFKDDPNIYVSGKRWSEEQVLPDEFMPTASISIGSLGQYCREKDDDFNGDPYLVPDPDIRKSIKGLLDSLGDKPKVGIAWTGGTKQSRQQFRQRTLEELVPLLRNKDVDWISLQYKDSDEEIKELKEKRGIEVHHYPWITEIKDYDFTAALVAELDLVISVPTSVTQLAGAVGTDAWVMVPEVTGWLFSRNDYVWANSVALYRNKPVKFMADKLNAWLNDRKGMHAIKVQSVK